MLDDGHRGEFRDFAQQISVHYIARENRAHAKAGNLNHALTKARGEYIAFFDCDHIVARSFLQVAMGWFFKDPQYALVQTPHHFFSPDPFERNLGVFRKIPSESNLFYGLVQQGNDFWNASFFCGSCAVMKREALEKVGGFSTASITEDAHTTLRMHRLGYKTAYLSIPQAAGLAVESLAAHIVQRARWAKGMTQIFRKDNPFWGRGLSFMQRVCYSSSLFHFLYGIPRMIFLTMPMAYLYFGLNVLNTVGWEILFYVIPHILLLYIVNVRTQGTYRNPFWAPIYEVIMAWYVIGPTLQALIHPKIGKFKVTVKGHRIQYEFVDWTLSIPYLVVIFINLSGVLSGVYHLWGATMVQLPAIVLNTAWALANLLILGAAIGVAAEARQIRVSHHIQATIPATLFLEDGRALQCYTEDYSKDGVGLVLSSAVKIPENSNAHILLKQGEQEFAFPARIVHSHVQENMQHLGLSFYSMNVQQEMQWTQVTFGRADAWLHEPPIPAAGFIRGMFGVSQMGFRGYVRLFASIKQLIEKRGVLRFKYRTR